MSYIIWILYMYYLLADLITFFNFRKVIKSHFFVWNQINRNSYIVKWASTKDILRLWWYSHFIWSSRGEDETIMVEMALTFLNFEVLEWWWVFIFHLTLTQRGDFFFNGQFFIFTFLQSSSLLVRQVLDFLGFQLHETNWHYKRFLQGSMINTTKWYLVKVHHT